MRNRQWAAFKDRRDTVIKRSVWEILIVLPNDFAEVLRAPKPLLEDVEGQALACPSD